MDKIPITMAYGIVSKLYNMKSERKRKLQSLIMGTVTQTVESLHV